MFGDLVGYNSTSSCQTSDDYNGKVDQAVQQILDVSIQHERTFCRVPNHNQIVA